jgi:hypothetical protein
MQKFHFRDLQPQISIVTAVIDQPVMGPISSQDRDTGRIDRRKNLLPGPPLETLKGNYF